MAIGSAAVWQAAQITAMPNVADTSWKANLALFIDDQTSTKLKMASIFQSGGAQTGTFTFNSNTFKNALSDNTVATLANAFSAGLTASTMAVAINSYIGSDPSNLATKFSAVASAVIDPASILLAKAKILELTTIPLTSNAATSQFSVKVREAFLLLTVTVTGTNSVTPTPSPLVVTAGAVA